MSEMTTFICPNRLSGPEDEILEKHEKRIDLSRLLWAAKQHLILHEYKPVISTCAHGLEFLQRTEHLDDNYEDSDQHRIKTAFGILAIQAVALEEGIARVESFVDHWFGEVRAVPPEILQLCVCLYLHTNNFDSAQNMIEEWLEDGLNHCRQGFEFVVELYIKNVLLPKDQSEKAQRFLDTCEKVTDERKMSLQCCITRNKEVARTVKSSSSIVAMDSNVQDKQESGTSFLSLFKVIRLCSTTLQLLRSMSLNSVLKTGARLVILFYFLYVVFTRTDMIGDIFIKGSSANLIWNAVRQAWGALFAPYHMMPK